MKNKLRKLVSVMLMCCFMCALCTACGGKDDGDTEISGTQDAGSKNSETETEGTGERQVVDMKGYTITIPAEVDSYIVLWKSYTGIMAMLDGCKGLMGCDYSTSKDTDKWLFEMCPDAEKLTVVTEEITAEEVANMNVDVVFWQNAKCEDLANQLNQLGIAAVNINFTDYETMKQSVSIAAEVLGTESAKTTAKNYNAYLDTVIAEISKTAENIQEEDKLNIVNLRNVETLRADGKNTVADTWINCIGAINMVGAKNLEGNQYLEIEQLYEWNPDIIVSSVAGDDAVMYSDELYASLSAVENQRVYINPYGIFAWNRYSVETPLQLYWAANTFYPELFSDIDVKQEMKDFYKEFFSYEISDENIENMLKAVGPQ